MTAHEFRNDGLREEIEHLSITEEAGDVDQQILGEQIEFACVAAQYFEISIRGCDRRRRHASLDPTLQRARFVER